MALTDFGALDPARKRIWSDLIWRAGRDAMFWMANGFMARRGEDRNRPIHRVTELTATERGEKAIMNLVAEMSGDGVVGDNLLTGNEETLFNDAIELTLDQLRLGVRNKGRMSEQRTVIRFRQTAREKLSYRFGELLDEMLFLTASGVAFTFKPSGKGRGDSQLPGIAFASDVTAPTAGRTMFAGTATSTATLTADDKMTWNLVVRAHSLAKRRNMKPIREGGRSYYVLVLSTEQCHDLKTDSTYQELVSKAHFRGTRNPLFNNAIAVIDGIVIYEHNKVFNTLDAASGEKYGAAGTIDGAQALLLGAQALGFAEVHQPEYVEADTNDYENRPGLAVGRMIGMVKPVFKSLNDGWTAQDFGVISMYTAAADLR